MAAIAISLTSLVRNQHRYHILVPAITMLSGVDGNPHEKLYAASAPHLRAESTP